MYSLGQNFVETPSSGHWYDPLLATGMEILRKVVEPRTTVYLPATTSPMPSSSSGISSNTVLLITAAAVLAIALSSGRHRR